MIKKRVVTELFKNLSFYILYMFLDYFFNKSLFFLNNIIITFALKYSFFFCNINFFSV